MLEERARIAREIHDVLAHSLGALGIQIQAAKAVLTYHQDIGRAVEVLTTAQRMAADGLAETRRAVYALRADTLPLEEELGRLAEAHRTRYHGPVEFGIAGPARPLPPDATVALLRTAQEALVNAAKHAPGQGVVVRLDYEAHDVRLTIRNDVADGRADVCALACVLYQCLTAESPYPGDTLEEQVTGHLTVPPPKPCAVNPAVPAAFDEVIARGMAKDPELRYQTTRELAGAAAHALVAPAQAAVTLVAQPSEAATAPVGAEQKAHPRGVATLLRRRWKLAAVAGVICAVVAGVVVRVVPAGVVEGCAVLEDCEFRPVRRYPTVAAARITTIAAIRPNCTCRRWRRHHGGVVGSVRRGGS